jgi:hypothetical protein
MARKRSAAGLPGLPQWLIESPVFPFAIVALILVLITAAVYFGLTNRLRCADPRQPTPIACNAGPGHVPTDEVP